MSELQSLGSSKKKGCLNMYFNKYHMIIMIEKNTKESKIRFES